MVSDWSLDPCEHAAAIAGAGGGGGGCNPIEEDADDMDGQNQDSG